MRRSRSGRWAVIGVGIMVLAALGWWILRPGPRVVFLGDSITVVSVAEIKSELGRAYRPDISAVLGIQAGQMIPTAQRVAANSPSQVVIALGSNDVLHHAPLGQAAADLTQIVSLFPTARCIHIVNINTHMTNNGKNGKTTAARAGLLNAAIVHLASTDPRISIIDWNQLISTDVAAHPPLGTLTDDTVHPNLAGRARLATTIKAGLDQCTR